MYTVSDVVELGNAHELVLGLIKDWFVFDDSWYVTMRLDLPW